MKLTQKMVNAARPPQQGQAFLRDTELRGFALRTTTRGSKTYVLEKKIDGRIRRLSLGPASALSVEQARDLAKIKIGEIANGRDPAEERRAKQHSVTFHELERLYIDRHLVHNKSKRDDIGRLDNHLAFLRPRRLSDIARAELAALHADLGAAGHRVGANAMLALVSSMMNRATEWGLFAGVNPASGIKRFKTASRSRFVSPAELPKLWAAMQREPNPYVRGAFFIGLLTGARRSEVLTMRWSDLDLEQSVWTIPVTKANRPHYVPLPGLVLEELKKLPRCAENPFVFCGRWGKSRLVNVSKPWRRIRKEAGLDDVTIHDLRRTCASWMVGSGVSLPVIGKTLGHSQAATTEIYARLQLQPVRLALEANAVNMLAVATRQTEGAHGHGA